MDRGRRAYGSDEATRRASERDTLGPASRAALGPAGRAATPRFLPVALRGIALLSSLAGAVLSVLPALVIGIIHLFYNSAGGILILLGSLMSLLPHPAVPDGGSGGALPVFQALATHPARVIVRAVVGTVSCGGAVLVIAARRGTGTRRGWVLVGACCTLAGIVGGGVAAVALLPAVAVSIGCIVGSGWRAVAFSKRREPGA